MREQITQPGREPGSELGTDMSEPLSEELIIQEMQGLPNWTYDDKAAAIERTYHFEDDGAAERFLSELHELAREAHYEPRAARDGPRVTLVLSTEGRVTHRDLEYARLVHALPERMP
jgi:pterin-4a-carbinolamine dehydratase